MKESRHRKRIELGHAGQIITTRRTIVEFIWDNELPVTGNTIYLIAEFLNGRKDYVRLYSVCSRLYYLSKLVYKGKEGIRKFSEEQYKTKIFDPQAETPDEVYHTLVSVDKKYEKLKPEDIFLEDLQNCFDRLIALWCKNLSCFVEQVYIPELAYAFEYIVERRGKLPAPEFDGDWSLFPNNYEDYNYTESVAAYFDDVMITCF